MTDILIRLKLFFCWVELPVSVASGRCLQLIIPASIPLPRSAFFFILCPARVCPAKLGF